MVCDPQVVLEVLLDLCVVMSAVREECVSSNIGLYKLTGYGKTQNCQYERPLGIMPAFVTSQKTGASNK